MSFAGFFMVAGYSVALMAYLLFPKDYFIQAWCSNILAEIFFYMGWTYFAIAGIFINKGKLNIMYALVVLAFGFVSVFAAALFFKPYELSAENGMNFNRNFLIDFTQYLLAIVLVMVYSNAFIKGFSQFKNKIGVVILTIGTTLGFVGSNIVTLSPDPAFAIFMQVVVNFGSANILFGLVWLGQAIKSEKATN